MLFMNKILVYENIGVFTNIEINVNSCRNVGTGIIHKMILISKELSSIRGL